MKSKQVLTLLLILTLSFTLVLGDGAPVNFVIKPQFEKASGFHDSLARVLVKSKDTKLPDVYGFIDKTGKIAIPPKFLAARDYSEGLAAVYFRDEKGNPAVGYINTKGIFVYKSDFKVADIKPASSDSVPLLGDFHSGRALVRHSRYGLVFIDNHGKIVIRKNLQGAGDFHEGLASVSASTQTNRRGYMDLAGNLVIKPQFIEAYDFSGGKAVVGSESQKKGTTGGESGLVYKLIDKKGNVLITLPAGIEIPKGGKFMDGMLRFKKDGKYGYIGPSGNIIIKPVLEQAAEFHEGLARVGMMGSDKKLYVGYIDKQGRWAVGPMDNILEVSKDASKDLGDFVNGFAVVGNKDESGKFTYGLIDKKGKIILEMKYDYLGNAYEGLCPALVKNLQDTQEALFGYVKVK